MVSLAAYATVDYVGRLSDGIILHVAVEWGSLRLGFLLRARQITEMLPNAVYASMMHTEERLQDT